MGQSAKVTSVDALRDFREVLFKFCERARDGLCATQMDSRRVVDRLLFELPSYWKQQVHERQEDLAQAQAEWHRVKLMRAQDYKVDEVGPRKALERAKARLEEAEEKIEKVRHWGRVAQRAVEEYEGRARGLTDLVDCDPPPSIVFLDRVVAALDAYLKVAPPPGSPDTPAAASAAPAAFTTAVPAGEQSAKRSGG